MRTMPEPTLDPAALYGIAGRTVKALRPHTEACDATILVSLLVSIGNAAGRSPHVIVESDRHGVNLFATLVGESSRARKGTAAGRVAAIMRVAEPDWFASAQFSGFGSGEGVIAELGDEERGDHRLLVDERELSSLLTAAARADSILSAIIRNAWDGVPLRTRTKHGRVVVDQHHVSVMGHITRDELERKLNASELANGFANRFLWVHTCRERLLPHGGRLGPDEITVLGERLGKALHAARRIELVTRTIVARKLWEDIYADLAASELVGMAGAITNRAEAHVLRLSLLYALLDSARQINEDHQAAALALWRYCEASALYIWADVTGDPDVDRLVAAARHAGPAGLTFTEAFERVFSKHRKVGPIAERAERYGLVKITREDTGGRPRDIIHAVERGHG